MIQTLCIGEILWDIFPDHKIWGGAPANFIFHTAQFGAKATAYTSIGKDPLGQELAEKVMASGIDLKANLSTYPTGIVDISLDANGTASYNFNKDCAWDHIPYTEELGTLSSQSDLICFGSLAQRSPESRETILKAIRNKKSSAKVLFDINLRQKFYTKEIIETSLKEADFLKLNEEELIILNEMFPEFELKEYLTNFTLELIILTLGEEGSTIITKSKDYTLPAFPCELVDTVGAGDSFTACFIINYLKGMPIEQAQKLASRVAAYVCENAGATINIPDHIKTIQN